MRIVAENGQEYRKDQYSDPYYRMFLSNTCLRESCYQCPAKGLHRRADITLADFWGVENAAPELIDGGGISLYIAHNEKGKRILRAIKSQTNGTSVEFAKAIEGNPAFFNSYKRPTMRDMIEKDIYKLSMNGLVRKYTYNPREVVKIVLHKLNLTRVAKKLLLRH